MACILYSTAGHGEDPALRDPTEPANYTVNVSKDSENAVDPNVNIVLEAVIISGDKKIAIINDNILKIGDVIGDKEIISIDSHSVTLSSNREKEIKLLLSGKPIKEAAQ